MKHQRQFFITVILMWVWMASFVADWFFPRPYHLQPIIVLGMLSILSAIYTVYLAVLDR